VPILGISQTITRCFHDGLHAPGHFSSIAILPRKFYVFLNVSLLKKSTWLHGRDTYTYDENYGAILTEEKVV